ncbi:MAG: c-type cytochrome [Pirellulaceae bacterium]
MRAVPDDQVADLLIDAWNHLSVPQRVSASATLMARPTWVTALVEALERRTINPNQLDAATVQFLRSYRDRNLRSRAAKVFGEPTPRAEVVTRYLAEMPAPPNRSPQQESTSLNPPTIASAGERLFVEHCAACHRAQPGGQMVGPPLENLGHWTIDQWLTGILDPNRNVEPKYRQSLVLTSDDETLAGIIQERSSANLRLAQADGTMRELLQSEIEEVQETQVSLMPEGFESKLSPEQLSILLGYLRSR